MFLLHFFFFNLLIFNGDYSNFLFQYIYNLSNDVSHISKGKINYLFKISI